MGFTGNFLPKSIGVRFSISYPAAIFTDVWNCRCGFAQSQEAYDEAVDGLFTTLDTIEDHLSRSRYLCGDKLTIADVCLFTTLIRFDVAYNVLFKCSKKKLVEYPNLHAYTRDIYQVKYAISIRELAAIV